MDRQRINQAHCRQLDQSDCGIACLLSVLRYHGGDARREQLRLASGTDQRGTNLLGIAQTARQLGLEAEGYEAGLTDLQQCPELCILHTNRDNRYQHFVVYYGFDAARQRFAIGDPAEAAIRFLTPEELTAEWPSGRLLLLRPTERIATTADATATASGRSWLLRLVRPDINYLFLALGLGIVVSLLGLSTALFSQQLVDNILPSGDRLRLFLGSGLLVVLLFARGGLNFLRGHFLLRQGERFNVRVIDYFFSHLLSLPKSFFDRRKTGDLVARMNDTQRIQRTVSEIAGTTTIDFIVLLLAGTTLWWLNWTIGLVSLGWLVLFALFVYRFNPSIVARQRQVMGAYANTESYYVDTVQGIEAIKLGNREEPFKRITQTVYGAYQRAIVSLGNLGLRYQLGIEFLNTLFMGGLIVICSWQILRNTTTIGELLAILQIAGMVLASALQLARAHVQVQEAKIAFDRMYEFTGLPPEYESEVDSTPPPTIELNEFDVRDLSFGFPGQPLLFSDVNFRVRRGEMISILGESGCGKSTLLHLAEKFYSASAGSIRVDGRPLSEIPTAAWRSSIGVVPQQPKIFTGTVLDNILLGQEPEPEDSVADFLREFGFDRYFDRLPQGVATLVGEGGINLSGGQCQLVALARALYHRPQLLLLDEPSAALDRHTEQFVLNLLKKYQQQAAIVLLTHRLLPARQADCIYVFERGTIRHRGRHEELIQVENLYGAAWRDLVA